MEMILNAFSAFSNWAWGMPLTIVLLGTGLFSTIITKGEFFYRWKFCFSNTYGKIFKKADGVGTPSKNRPYIPVETGRAPPHPPKYVF